MPLYIFPSGGFQLVDIPLVLLAIFTLSAMRKSEIKSTASVILMLGIYVFWAIFVNTMYFLQYANMRHLQVCGQILFTYLLFSVFIITFQRVILSKRGVMIFYPAILLALFMPFLIKGEYDMGHKTVSFLRRNALSFDNPNQLAYFSVLIYAMSILLRRNIVKYGFTAQHKVLLGVISFCIFMLSHLFVMFSASRAGIVSIILLDVIVVWQNKRRFLIPISLFILLCVVTFPTNPLPDINFSKFVTSPRMSKDFKKILSNRVGERFSQNLPDEMGFLSMLYGAGKPSVSPFRETEVHNGFIDIFASYGAIGILLFFLFLFFLAVRFIFVTRTNYITHYMAVLFAVFAYNLAHNGFRFRFFWIFLAFWHTIAAYSKTKTIESKLS